MIIKIDLKIIHLQVISKRKNVTFYISERCVSIFDFYHINDNSFVVTYLLINC